MKGRGPTAGNPNCPANERFEIALNDGRTVCARSVRTCDAEAFLGFFDGLSARSRAFMRGFRCDREHAEHIAAQAESGHYYGLAVFASDVPSDRMVAYSWIDGLEGPDIPMLGIGVVDEYQNVGLGRALLRLMIRSAGHLGLRRLRLGVFEHNSRAIHVYESVGFRMDATTPPRVFNGHTETYMMTDTGNGPEASLPNGPS